MSGDTSLFVMRDKYWGLLDLLEMGVRNKTVEAECWKIRSEAYKVLAICYLAGEDVEKAAHAFAWSIDQLDNEALQKWLCPELWKSEQTPYLSSHHAPIGHEGVWHSKHPPMQLPAYVQNIRNALMRAGHGEQEAHAMAVAAVKRWAKGKGAWGKKGKPTPVVQQAAQRAVQEWEELRRHHPLCCAHDQEEEVPAAVQSR